MTLARALTAAVALVSLGACRAHSEADAQAGSIAGAGGSSPATAPTLAAPPATGYLERRDDGTCWWNHGMYFCPRGAMCKPTPPPKQVLCPALTPPLDETVVEQTGAWTESRGRQLCLTGPDPTHLRAFVCPWVREGK